MDKRKRFVVAVLAGILAAALEAPAPVHAACEFDPGNEDATCGPQTPNPPQDSTGTGSPPRIVAWTSGYDVNPFDGSRSGIYVARVSGTNRRRVVAFSNVKRDFEPHGLNLPDDHPSFSPDSRRLVLTSNRADPDNWDVYVMNVNGTGVKRLTSTPGLDTEPVFSPDGTRIAFATERFGALDLAIMNADGSNVRRLTTNPREDIEPAWRPDGQEIAFARVQSADEKDVFVIKPDGTGERRLTFTPGEDHDPTYSPNGQELVITSERNPSPPFGNVHRIRVSDGADLGDLTSDLDFGAGDPFWSRDGGLVAFFKSAFAAMPSPQQLFVMNSGGGQKFHIPGEASGNVHPALGLGVDDDGDGVANYLESATTGKATVSPSRLRAGRLVRLRFGWRHPRRWRRLDSMSLRFSQERWLRAAIAFSVRDGTVRLFNGEDGVDDFTRARRPGRPGVLRTPLVSLDLGRSRVVNVNRRTIRLLLALRFPRAMAGERLTLRVQADDVLGRHQDEAAGTLRLR